MRRLIALLTPLALAGCSFDWARQNRTPEEVRECIEAGRGQDFPCDLGITDEAHLLLLWGLLIGMIAVVVLWAWLHSLWEDRKR